MNYSNTYYNLFQKKHSKTPPVFNEQESYIMRFQTELPYYSYDGNSTTLIYFKKGNGAFVVGKESTTIGDNQFIIANPNTEWEYVNRKQTDIDVLSFVIAEEVVSKLNYFTDANLNTLLEMPFSHSNSNFFFSKQAFNANYYQSGNLLKHLHAYSNTDAYELECPEDVSMRVLDTVFTEQKKAYAVAEKVIGSKRNTKIEVFRRLLVAYEYIHDNLSTKITIKDLSLVAGLSEFHLYKSFKRIFGQTPHQYITIQKMKKAQELLVSGRFTSSEVALSLDYPDLPTFSKVYKKTFGISPSLVVI